MIMSATRLAQGMSTQQATPVTRDKGRGISRALLAISHFSMRLRILEYGWTYVPNMMWYMQDNDGDENYGLYRLG